MRGRSLLVLLAGLLLLSAGVLRFQGQMAPGSVEMSGVKPAMKLQVPLEGFFTPINGKFDMRASEVDFEPGGAVKDHYHFGPGIRRVLAGELTIVHPEKGTEQKVRAGEFFWESGDVNIHAYNRGTEPAKLLIIELVPAGLKGSAMVPLARRGELEQSGWRLKELVCSKN